MTCYITGKPNPLGEDPLVQGEHPGVSMQYASIQTLISPDNPRMRNRRAATVLSLIDELAFIGNCEEDDYAGEGLHRKARAPNPPVERYKGKQPPWLRTSRPKPLNSSFQAYHDDDQRAGVASFQDFERFLAGFNHH